MKKLVSLLLALMMAFTLSVSFAEGEELSIGMAMVTNVKGTDATAEKNGVAQGEIEIAAVTVDANGVVTACVIDMIQSKIYFDDKGALTTETTAEFPSKNVLGDAYGMRVASSISKEWNEQAAAFADWCIGKTLDEIKGIAVDEKGKATDADVLASVTLSVSPFVAIVEKAINNAVPCGAKADDILYLASYTVCSSSKSATAEKAGNAQAYATVGAFTVSDGVITAAKLDAVQANCAFDAAGKVTADLSQPIASKNELGDGYGMRVASALGKEWNEQAEGFCQYVTGKTVVDACAIPVNDAAKTTDADLAASCTVTIDAFLNILTQIAE